MSKLIHVLICGFDADMFAEFKCSWEMNGGVCYYTPYINKAMPDIVANKYDLISILAQPGNDMSLIRDITIIRGVSTVPIIVATHDDIEKDFRLKILAAGADQFYVFPISIDERIAISRALLRRVHELNTKNPIPVTIFFRKYLTVSVEQRIVLIQDQEINLKPKEFDILCMLVERPGIWFSPYCIYERVWHDEPTENCKDILWSHISRLRDKLHISPSLPELIQSQRGVGYRYIPDGR